MKICLISHYYPPESTGGIEIYTENLARVFHARGHEVQVICAGRKSPAAQYTAPPRDTIQDEIKIRRYDINWRLAPNPFQYLYNNPQAARWIEEFLEENRPDVAHITSTYSLSASIIFAVRSLGIPTFVTLYDFWFLCPRTSLLTSNNTNCDGNVTTTTCLDCMAQDSRFFRRLKKKLPPFLYANLLKTLSHSPIPLKFHGLENLIGSYAARRNYIKKAIQTVNRLITPCRFMDDFFRSHDFPSHLFLLIPAGISTSWYTQRIPRYKSDFLRIGYLGQVIPTKGVHTLIEAAALLKGSYQVNIYGSLAQEPAYADSLTQMARGNPNIAFRGAYTRADLEEILAHLDLVVMPSLFQEPFGIVAREALLTHTPVVAAAQGGIIEAIQPGVNGELFPPGDAVSLSQILQKLIDQPAIVEKWKEAPVRIRTLEDEASDLEAEYQRWLTSSQIIK